MLTLLLAAAAAATPAKLGEDPDFRCMVATSIALERIAGDDEASSEERSSITSVFMYYFGKVDARHAGTDYVAEVIALVETPGYVQSKLQSDLARCGREATQLGRTLDQMGKTLQDRWPQAAGKPR